MGLLIFKPSRDARHRAACLALYRSLLRLSTRVPLPPHLATSGPLRHPSAPTGQNPLRALVTRHFTHNRPLVSARLVTAALTQGYRFLSLLTSESAPGGPSPRLLAFLSANAARLAAHRAERAALRAKYAPGPDLVPLITKVADDPPRYAPTGPPRAVAPGKVRFVPTFDDCEGIPFLRMRGRQSFVLSAMLNRKLGKRRERLELMEELAGEGVPAAAEEDEWEWLVGGGWKEGGGWERKVGYQVRGGAGSWKRDADEGVQVVSELLQGEFADMVARSRGYWEVLEQERRAAGRERMVRKRMVKEGRLGEGEGSTAGGDTVGRGRRKTGRAYERKR